MSRNKKPRKAYRPRQVCANTLAMVLHQVAKPPKQDRAEILGVLKKALTALREGVATEQQWSIAAGSVAMAQAIESQGVVRGLLDHIKAAEQALQDIYDRATRNGGGRWVRVTMYAIEIDALQTFFEVHAFQIDQLSRDEFITAIDMAEQNTTTQGHTATIAHDLERMAA